MAKKKGDERDRDDAETRASSSVAGEEAGAGPTPKMKRKEYERQMRILHGELVAMQEWVKESGAKICIVFEGRDTAGKGGTIKRITERVSPRVFRVVALPTPTEREKSQMYVQSGWHVPAARHCPHRISPGRVGAPGQAEGPVRGARSAVAQGWELRRKSEHEQGRRSVGPGRAGIPRHHVHARPGPAGLPGCGRAGQAVLCRSRHRRGRRRREGQAVVRGRDPVRRPYLCGCGGTGVRGAGGSRTGPDRPAASSADRWPDRDARCGRLRPLRFPHRRPAARAQCAAME